MDEYRITIQFSQIIRAKDREFADWLARSIAASMTNPMGMLHGAIEPRSGVVSVRLETEK